MYTYVYSINIYTYMYIHSIYLIIFIYKCRSPISKSKKSVNASWEQELLFQMEAERSIVENDFHDENESPGEGGYIEGESWCNGSLYDRRIEGDFNMWNEGLRLSRDGIQSSYAGTFIRGPGTSFIRNKDNTVIRGPDIRGKPSAGLNLIEDNSDYHCVLVTEMVVRPDVELKRLVATAMRCVYILI
jgi:hypothetical protein